MYDHEASVHPSHDDAPGHAHDSRQSGIPVERGRDPPFCGAQRSGAPPAGGRALSCRRQPVLGGRPPSERRRSLQ